jgi:predicted kinase
MKLLQVIMCVGLPASGKSTWAKNKVSESPNSYKRINKDDLRAMLDNSHHSKDAEKFILKVRDNLILMALEAGKHVIIDDTNLAPKHEAHIRELIKGKAELHIQDFRDVPLKTCIERDLKRCNSVGSSVIRQMYNHYIRPQVQAQVLAYNSELPKAIICDLDGTLALISGRSPFDASTCENDELNTVVASLLVGKNVIFVSGREDKYREPTERFLAKHSINYLHLWMRQTADFRQDAIIKKEIYEQKIKGQFQIEFVLDDRNQVVDMWREQGLTCLQVAEGDF